MKHLLTGLVLLIVVLSIPDLSKAENELPSITEFKTCVHLSSRLVTARDGECKRSEVEVKIEGDYGGGNNGGDGPQLFDSSSRQVGELVTIYQPFELDFPANSLSKVALVKFNQDGTNYLVYLYRGPEIDNGFFNTDDFFLGTFQIFLTYETQDCAGDPFFFIAGFSNPFDLLPNVRPITIVGPEDAYNDPDNRLIYTVDFSGETEAVERTILSTFDTGEGVCENLQTPRMTEVVPLTQTGIDLTVFKPPLEIR